MHHPAEQFIRYLLSSGVSTSDMREVLRKYSIFAEIDSDYISKLSASTGIAPEGKHARRNFYRERKLFLAYSQAKEYKSALAILTGDNRALRKAVELFILGGIDPEASPKYLLELFGVNISPRTLQTYSYYFWDRNCMSYDEWKHFLIKQNVSDFYLYLGCLNNGKEHTLWKLGYREELDLKQLAEVGMHEAAMRFLELHSFPNNRDVATTASLWTDTLLKYKEISEEKGSKLDEVIERLQGIKISLDKRQVKSIDEATDGLHSEAKSE